MFRKPSSVAATMWGDERLLMEMCTKQLVELTAVYITWYYLGKQ